MTGAPLPNDTDGSGVIGVDMGANTPSDSRLYIFFGAVAVEQDPNKKYSHGESVANGNPSNSDLVAWTAATDVLRRGGHLALG